MVVVQCCRYNTTVYISKQIKPEQIEPNRFFFFLSTAILTIIIGAALGLRVGLDGREGLLVCPAGTGSSSLRLVWLGLWLDLCIFTFWLLLLVLALVPFPRLRLVRSGCCGFVCVLLVLLLLVLWLWLWLRWKFRGRESARGHVEEGLLLEVVDVVEEGGKSIVILD